MRLSPSTRGTKRASSIAARRRLALVRRLLRAPASTAELIAAVNEHNLDDGYPVAKTAAVAALRHDLQALRRDWDCVIEYRPKLGYVLRDLGALAVLDLPDEALAGIAFLRSAYTVTSSQITHQQVRLLLDRLLLAVPEERRDQIERQHSELRIVGPESRYYLHTPTLQSIRRGLKQRQYIQFDYAPTLRPRIESHRVAPAELISRDSHTYLVAHCPEPPRHMEECYGGYVEFRVDQIVVGTIRVLPTRLPRDLPPRPCYSLMYELAPVVACNRHVAHWFPDTQITYRGDGSALVTAMTHNLWQAQQILIRYIENCRVHEPPELVSMLRQTIRKMGALYDA
jgi:proteasome accessory factor C